MIITYEVDNGIQATFNITKMQATFLVNARNRLLKTLQEEDLTVVKKETTELVMRHYILERILRFFYDRMPNKLFDGINPLNVDAELFETLRKYIIDNVDDKYISVLLSITDFLSESAGRTINSHYCAFGNALNLINLRLQNLLIWERIDYEKNGQDMGITMNTVEQYATDGNEDELQKVVVERLTLSVASHVVNRYNELLNELSRALQIEEIKLLQFYYPKNIDEQVEYYNETVKQIERLAELNDANPLVKESKKIVLKSLFVPFDYQKEVDKADIRKAVDVMFEEERPVGYFYDIVYKGATARQDILWDTFVQKPIAGGANSGQ